MVCMGISFLSKRKIYYQGLMSMRPTIVYGMLSLALLTCTGIYSSILITGDADPSTGTTFTFNVQEHYANASGENFYVGAAAAGTGKQFSLAHLSAKNTAFNPLASQSVTLNGIITGANPLFDAQIALIGL